jgi:uncharacterized protein (TIGR02145 family)
MMEVGTMNQLYKFALGIIFIIGFSCTVNPEGPNHHIPSITAMSVVSVGQTTARCRSNVTSDGGATVTEKGVCWSATDTMPTYHDARTIDGSGTGEFFSSISGLTPNTRYYARTYAINEVGYNYDTTRTFVTLNYGGIVVIDHNPDSLNAFWQIDGPNANDFSGDRDTFFTDMVPGLYRISWSDIPGWSTPGNMSTTLNSGSTITFTGNYARIFGSDSVGTVTDADGNVYRTVKIGDQWWMAENLRVAHYQSDETIPNVTDGTAWGDLNSGAYCDYNNDTSNAVTYGHLYNWYAAAHTGIAPDGWHVPSADDWNELIAFLGGSTDAGGRLKETLFSHWALPNTGATNESGFTGLPSGMRDGTDGAYRDQHYVAYLWSRSQNNVFEPISYYLVWVSSSIDQWPDGENQGFAIRCVKD